MKKDERKFSLWKTIGIIGFSLPIILGAFFMYEMSFKQFSLAESQSPNKAYVIEVIEIGEPVNEGPSKIKIKADSASIELGLRHEGDFLDEDNVNIDWETDTVAEITLTGKGQKQATIVLFDANATEKLTITKDGSK